MSTDQNAALARRFVMEHNKANYMASLDELLAPGCVIHEYLPGLPAAMDRTIYNQFLAGFRQALPDIHNEVEDVIAAGDKVAVRWTGYGTHTGEPLMGIPATNQTLTAHGIYIIQLANGKIVEVWDNWDNLNVSQQLSGQHLANA